MPDDTDMQETPQAAGCGIPLGRTQTERKAKVNIIHIDLRPATSTETTRDSFGQAAYAGLLPRDRWIAAQDLIARHDATQDATMRANLVNDMRAMLVTDVSVRTAA